jgi:hypothetical protein
MFCGGFRTIACGAMRPAQRGGNRPVEPTCRILIAAPAGPAARLGAAEGREGRQGELSHLSSLSLARSRVRPRGRHVCQDDEHGGAHVGNQREPALCRAHRPGTPDQIAEYARLAKGRREADKPAQVAPVSGGRGNAGGDRQAARDLGVTRDEILRAEKISSIKAEAKGAAATAGVSHNQSAAQVKSKRPRAFTAQGLKSAGSGGRVITGVMICLPAKNSEAERTRFTQTGYAAGVRSDFLLRAIRAPKAVAIRYPTSPMIAPARIISLPSLAPSLTVRLVRVHSADASPCLGLLRRHGRRLGSSKASAPHDAAHSTATAASTALATGRPKVKGACRLTRTPG